MINIAFAPLQLLLAWLFVTLAFLPRIHLVSLVFDSPSTLRNRIRISDLKLQVRLNETA